MTMLKRINTGFTLIELLVVMVIIATLLTIAVPRYFHSVDRSREAVLRQDLSLMREALDKYYGDNGKYPDALDELVSKRYLRSMPVDPLTGSARSWLIVEPGATDKGRVYDVRSGAPGTARDGSRFVDW